MMEESTKYRGKKRSSLNTSNTNTDAKQCERFVKNLGYGSDFRHLILSYLFWIELRWGHETVVRSTSRGISRMLPRPSPAGVS